MSGVSFTDEVREELACAAATIEEAVSALENFENFDDGIDPVAIVEPWLRGRLLALAFEAFGARGEEGRAGKWTFVREGHPRPLVVDLETAKWRRGTHKGQSALSAIALVTGKPALEIARRVSELTGLGCFLYMSAAAVILEEDEANSGGGA